MKTIDPAEIAVPELHGYLLSAVAPRPIAFVSTIDAAGNVNLSPFSYFNVFSINPPIMVFSPSRRGRDNTTKHTYENLLEVPEAVINTVNYSIVEQMSLSSTEYERGVNEFEKSGLTQVSSVKVKPPRVGESPVAFECVIDDIVPLGDQGGAGTLMISRVVLVHIQEQYLGNDGKLETTKLDLVGRMGGNWYTRAYGASLFEIPKPLRAIGMGVDRLPEAVRLSPVLTGNNLGRLGNTERLPDSKAIEARRQASDVISILGNKDLDSSERTERLHRLAQACLERGAVEEALEILLIEA